MKAPLTAIAAFTAACSSGTVASPSVRADLLIVNARVYTGDPARPWVESVAIRGDRLVEASTATRVVDAGGRVVIPGLNDAHAHPPGLPESNFTVLQLGPAADSRQTLEAVRAAAATAPAGRWILGNLGLVAFDEPAFTRRALDAAVSAHPVMLVNFAGHIMMLNSAATAALGLSDDAPLPLGGIRHGEYLHEYAIWSVERAVGAMQSDDGYLGNLEAFAAEAASFGITTVQAMPFAIDHRHMLALLERTEPSIRWRVMRVPIGGVATIDDVRAVDPAARVSLSGTKYVLDGTPLERGAAMIEDYSDRPGVKGRLNFSRADITAMMKEALRTGDQLHFHVAGDLALKTVLELMEATGGPAAWHDQRLVIEHGYVLGPTDFARAHELGVIVVHNPSHVTFPDLLRVRLGAERVTGWFRIRDLLAAHIPLAFGSDGPLNPFLDIMLVTTRPDDPAQAITREQAIAAYTTGSAYDEHLEGHKGRLVPGMLADLAVLSADPFTVPADQMPAIRSELTIVGGAIVHDTGALTPVPRPTPPSSPP